MRQTLQDKIANAKNLLDVLLVMKESIMIDTHVSTLAYFDHNVEPFNGTYGIASVRPFPLEEDQQPYEVQVYYFESVGDDFEDDTIVTVIFADRNFINNLNAVEPVGKPTDDTTLHTYKFGIITSTGVVAVKNLEKKIKELQEEIDEVAGDVNELEQAVRSKCEKIKFENGSTQYQSSNGLITLPDYPDEVDANVTVPSGTIPALLTNIKIGDNYYQIPASGETVDWSDIDNKPTNFAYTDTDNDFSVGQSITSDLYCPLTLYFDNGEDYFLKVYNKVSGQPRANHGYKFDLQSNTPSDDINLRLPNASGILATQEWGNSTFIKKNNLTQIDLGEFNNNVIVVSDTTVKTMFATGGFFMFMYSNCVCYTPINLAMLQASLTAPIRVPMAVIYDAQGQAKLGILRIEVVSSSDTNIRFRLNDVKNGFHLYVFAL